MEYPTQAPRRRGRPRKEEAGREPPANIFWRNGRAYGNFRSWAAWGGKREPLVAVGEKLATTHPNTAAILFARRLEALSRLRELNPTGLTRDELQSLPAYIEYHVSELANVQGRRRPTARYVENLRFRLNVAAEFFASRGTKLLRQLSSQDVHAFMLYLRTFVPRHPVLKRDRLSTTTQRQYMDALGHMLQRAASQGRVAKNWVRDKVDLPTPAASTTELLELGECALLLEAARRLFPPDRPGRPIYPLLAFLLFTGCIESERIGVELRDVHLPGGPIFPGGVVIIRPNAMRDRLKTIHRERMIPIQPQLGEILAEYLNGPNAPRGPLLFPEPSSDGTVPLGDWRKTLDQIAEVAGFARGKVRTRRFRVSFATHRLCTLDVQGLPMTAWQLRGEIGHGTEQMIERRYGRYAKFRGRSPVLEFRWEEWSEKYGLRLAAGIARVLTPSQHRTLAVLTRHPEGLSLAEWQRHRGSNPGTFFPQRDRFLQLGLVMLVTDNSGNRCYVATADGRAVARAETDRCAVDSESGSRRRSPTRNGTMSRRCRTSMRSRSTSDRTSPSAEST